MDTEIVIFYLNNSFRILNVVINASIVILSALLINKFLMNLGEVDKKLKNLTINVILFFSLVLLVSSTSMATQLSVLWSDVFNHPTGEIFLGGPPFLSLNLLLRSVTILLVTAYMFKKSS